MTWFVALLLLLAGYRFDAELASWLLFSQTEIHYLVTGSLIGLGTGYAIRKLEAM
jgi:hypothetical protein